MKAHHRNIKKISQAMEQWVQSNLNQFGIFECSYSRYDLVHNTWIPMPNFYDWHCKYLEKKFDNQIIDRFQQGNHQWEYNSLLYKNYLKQYDIKNKSILKPFKFDFFSKTSHGFEMVVVGSINPLSLYWKYNIYQYFAQLSNISSDIFQNYSHIELDFNPTEQLPRN